METLELQEEFVITEDVTMELIETIHHTDILIELIEDTYTLLFQ